MAARTRRKAAGPTFDTLTMVSVNDMTPRESNAKRHPVSQITKIAEAIKALGFNDPITLDADGIILEGHGRRLAVLEILKTDPEFMDGGKVPCIYKNLSGDEAEVYCLVHNRTNLETGLDAEIMVASLQEIGIAQDEAALAGVTDVEYTTHMSSMTQTDAINYGDGQSGTRELAAPAHRAVLKFATAEEYDTFTNDLVRLRSAYPGLTVADALLQFIAEDQSTKANIQ